MELDERREEREIQSVAATHSEYTKDSKPVTSIDMYIDRGGTCGQSCQRFSTNKTCLEFKSYSIFLVKIPVKIKIRFVLTDRTRDREREREKKDSQSTILSTVLSLRWSEKYAREIHSYDSG